MLDLDYDTADAVLAAAFDAARDLIADDRDLCFDMALAAGRYL